MKFILPMALSMIVLPVAAFGAAAENRWTVASPDGKLAATLTLGSPEGAKSDKPRLYYRVEQGPEGSRAVVLPWSPLGIDRSDASFVDGLKFAGRSAATTIDDAYTMPHGKRKDCRSHARQQTFAFTTPADKSIELVFRVSNEGVAFRYHFRESGEKPLKVTKELTGFQLPQDARAWMQPYSEYTKYTPAYEEYYLNDIPVGTVAPMKNGWVFPALFRVGPRWVLLTEAATDGSYCGCRLDSEAPGGLYSIKFPDPPEGWGQGDVEPTIKLPWASPWRVVMVTEGLGPIVESTLVNDLNPPCRIEDTSWIKPGRASWSWWSDHDSPQDYTRMTEFIDLAAEMGWEYFLVDANWTIMKNGTIHQLNDYAKQKGVGLLLWYNSGGEHNIVSEKPRGNLKSHELREFEFDLLRRWGVKGVKIDFFQSDKQNIMALYHGILEDAAKYGILINCHGCTLPRGWSRTWPNLVSMEAVRGAENYTFSKEYPERAPEFNAVLPFTRNVVGPMDYTPCTFSDDKHPHLTTNAHELALAVVFETAILHFADRVSAYRELPAEPKQFLKDIPVTWDETRFIDGYPGKFAAIARRKGNDWYVGAIQGTKQPMDLIVPLSFLGGGAYEAQVIADGDKPRGFASKKVAVKSGDVLSLKCLPYGGGVIHLKPKG